MGDNGQKWKKPKQYMILFAVITLLMIVVFGTLGMLFTRQLNYYRQSREAVQRLWTYEGMKDGALEDTINIVSVVVLSVRIVLMVCIVGLAFGLGGSLLTHNLMCWNIDVNHALEIGFVAMYQGIPGIFIIMSLLALDILSILVSLLVFGAFFWFTNKRVRKIELVSYAFFMSIPLLLLLFVFCSDGRSVISSSCVALDTYSKMNQDLKDKIFQFTGEAGIDARNVYVKKDRELNAAATSGLRFKYVFLNEGIIEALTEEQLLSVVYHEIGHVVYSHIPKRSIFLILLLIPIAALLIFIHRKIVYHYNGLAAFFAVNCLFFTLLLGLIAITNTFVTQTFEYEADRRAYTEKGYGEPLSESLKILALSCKGGMFFDYEKWMSPLLDHPSVYKRICRQRDHDAHLK